MTDAEIAALEAARRNAREVRKDANRRRYVRRMKRLDPRWRTVSAAALASWGNFKEFYMTAKII